MPRILVSFVAGLLFGLGLAVSQMINPAKVLGFLDLFGDWDPSLGLGDGWGDPDRSDRISFRPTPARTPLLPGLCCAEPG
jgi:hypothetical protein